MAPYSFVCLWKPPDPKLIFLKKLLFAPFLSENLHLASKLTAQYVTSL